MSTIDAKTNRSLCCLYFGQDEVCSFMNTGLVVIFVCHEVFMMSCEKFSMNFGISLQGFICLVNGIVGRIMEEVVVVVAEMVVMVFSGTHSLLIITSSHNHLSNMQFCVRHFQTKKNEHVSVFFTFEKSQTHLFINAYLYCSDNMQTASVAVNP